MKKCIKRWERPFHGIKGKHQKINDKRANDISLPQLDKKRPKTNVCFQSYRVKFRFKTSERHQFSSYKSRQWNRHRISNGRINTIWLVRIHKLWPGLQKMDHRHQVLQFIKGELFSIMFSWSSYFSKDLSSIHPSIHVTPSMDLYKMIFSSDASSE